MIDYDPESLLAAARAVWFYLPELVGPEEAKVIEDGIFRTLTRSDLRSVQDIARDLALQMDDERVTSWIQSDFRELTESYLFRPPAGLPARQRPPRYTCPVGHPHDWYRRSVGEPIPLCPNCGRQLVRPDDR